MRIFLAVEFNLREIRVQTPLDLSCFHQWDLPDGRQWTLFHHTVDGYLLRFPDLADFLILQDGRKVDCFPVANVTAETLHHLYLNQVLPLALSKQGKLVFHGSSVAIGTGAVAFMGESGRGKSTLAASFATNGFRFLTEDVLVVKQTEKESLILPSHPSIRLWEDSKNALIKEGTLTAPPVQFTPKMRFLAGQDLSFCDQPRPLRRVYFLGEGTMPQPVFERINQGKALYELVKNSFLLDISEHKILATHFDELSRLVMQPIFYRLDYPRRYEDLPFIRQSIVEHALNDNLAQ
jgi:hypothetical protein